MHHGGLEEEISGLQEVQRYAAELARVAFAWRVTSAASEASLSLPNACERLSGLCEEAWGEQRRKQWEADHQQSGGGGSPSGSLGAFVAMCCAKEVSRDLAAALFVCIH